MLLSVSGVGISFAADEVLHDVTFRLDRREKVALVGRNGCGKTTLLRILLGEYEPDKGSVTLARGARIGYLRQESQVERGLSVLEAAEQARQEEVALRQRLEELEQRMEAGATNAELEEYATLHERYMEMEAYSAERDLQTVLSRMGFAPEDYDKPTSALSGGEKTRLALARLLLEEPDLLILDEPTNHLDLQASEWLEGWLKNYPGAVLLVSHDRFFLEAVSERVLEMKNGEVRSYPGSFEKYLVLKAEEELRQAEVAKRQQKEIDKLDEYVRRFMNSQRTAQARGRLKMMEKLQASQVVAPTAEKSMKTAFKAAKRSGDVVWEAKGITKAYGDRALFQGFDWTVVAGERWGVVGENGAGKSTLVKVLMEQISPDSGSVRHGANLMPAYFAQDVVDLDPRQSPLDHLVYEFGLLPADARNLLGRFLFSGDDVFRPISTMSGGEKNKLVLASLTTLQPNLLVLDEPTNHLDMDSREALAQVLQDYQGTLILISHDRWLLDKVTNRTLDVRSSGIVSYPGSFGEYRRRLSKPQPTATSTKESRPAGPKLSPRELSKEITRLEKEIERMEHQITEREAELAALEAQLACPDEGMDLRAMTEEHASLTELIAGLMNAWEKTSLQLDEHRAMQG